MRIQKILLFTGCLFLILTLTGCEAFTRKFIRRPKEKKVEDVVLAPKDYSVFDISVEERYRKSFVFWKSWQSELITALGSSASHKKRRACVEEAVLNLQSLSPFLNDEKQKDLEVYLVRMRNLSEDIERDIHGRNIIQQRRRAQSLKRAILRDFSYPRVKGHLR